MTMRPVRILLVVLALVAVGLAGWALGARGGDDQPTAGPAATQAEPQAEPQATAPAAAPAPQAPAPSASTRGAPRPRIIGFGSEPVYPQKGGFWQLPAGPGEAVLVTDARDATRVEFLLTPTGTGDQAVSLGVDRNGRDGYLARWRYRDQPLLAHLTVRASGPGGTVEQSVGVYHPDPERLP